MARLPTAERTSQKRHEKPCPQGQTTLGKILAEQGKRYDQYFDKQWRNGCVADTFTCEQHIVVLSKSPTMNDQLWAHMNTITP